MRTTQKKYLSGLIPTLALGVAGAAAVACLASAHDGEHDAWYSGLSVPGTGSSCCNKNDCAPVLARIGKDGAWEVYIDDKTFPGRSVSPFEGGAPNAWVRVPEGAVLHGRDNPTGEPVACWFDQKVRCFIPSSES